MELLLVLYKILVSIPCFIFIFNNHHCLLLSILTRKSFYPQRLSEQGHAVVTGVFFPSPLPPQHVRPFLSRIPVRFFQHFHRLISYLCSSIYIEACQLTLSRFSATQSKLFFARKIKSLLLHREHDYALGKT